MSENQQLFILTEACGRQLMGYMLPTPADVVGPMADQFVYVKDPVMVKEITLQTPQGPGRAVHLDTIYGIGWTDHICVRPSSFSACNEEMIKAYNNFLAAAQKQYEVARAQAAGIHLADHVSPTDIAAHNALNQARQKH